MVRIRAITDLLLRLSLWRDRLSRSVPSTIYRKNFFAAMTVSAQVSAWVHAGMRTLRTNPDRRL